MNQWAAAAGLTYGVADNYREYPSNWDAFGWYHCMCSAQTQAGFVGNPSYPTVGPQGLISGRVAGSPPMPGWSGWDCSQRNCPTGDPLIPPYNTGGNIAIQRVVCSELWSANMSFILTVNGFPTLPIYSYYRADQIKRAIEWPPVIGNVTITFPRNKANLDNITTACDYSINHASGGFLVSFDTELGNIPLMSSSNSTVIVYEYQIGTKLNSECNGLTYGLCTHDTGVCQCSAGYGSSKGTNSPGHRGDCGYHDPYPK